jgi:nitric oxide reductase subunit B
MWALRLFNASIVLWLVHNLLPVGVAQLPAALDRGVLLRAEPRPLLRLDFFQWLRLPGDVVFLAAAASPTRDEFCAR